MIKPLLIMMMLMGAMLLAGCDGIGFLQIKEEKDIFAPLSNIEGTGFVPCSTQYDCQAYLEQNSVFDVNNQCREGVCHYESLPELIENPEGVTDDE